MCCGRGTRRELADGSAKRRRIRFVEGKVVDSAKTSGLGWVGEGAVACVVATCLWFGIRP